MGIDDDRDEDQDKDGEWAPPRTSPWDRRPRLSPPSSRTPRASLTRPTGEDARATERPSPEREIKAKDLGERLGFG